MAKGKRLPTFNEQEYAKELRRLKQFIRRATKRGFIFPINPIPERPKRITQASVNRLKKITPTTLYKKATPPVTTQTKPTKTVGAATGKAVKIEKPITGKPKSFKAPNIKYTITAPENIRKEYSKQRTRVREFMRRARYRGYTFPDGILPTTRAQYATQELVDYLKGLTPQKLYEKAQYKDPLTGDVMTGIGGRKLERQRAARKAQETHRKNIEAGKKFKPREKKKPTKKSEKKTPNTGADKGNVQIPDVGDEDDEDAEDTEVILRYIMEEISGWTPDPSWSKDLTRLKQDDRDILERTLYGAINEDGEEAVAKRLAANASEVNTILQQVLYSSGGKGDVFDTGRSQANFDLTYFSSIVKGRALDVFESIQLTEAAEAMEVNN